MRVADKTHFDFTAGGRKREKEKLLPLREQFLERNGGEADARRTDQKVRAVDQGDLS
jgi:hypothetical protein